MYSISYEIGSHHLDSLRSVVPIIMIHGAIVSSKYLLPTAECLSEQYQIFVLDLPGHGLSSKPPHAVPVIEQSEIIREWMRKLSIEKAIIFANSYGCEIAVEIAVRYPEVVDSLILTGPTADPSAPTKRQQFLRLMLDAFVEPIFMFVLLVREMFLLGWNRAFETAQQMIDYDYEPRLPLVKCRTFVVRGGNDHLSPQKWVEKLVSLLPDAKLAVIPNAPHTINFSTPNELAALVRNFLA